jgi:hypothetical protein
MINLNSKDENYNRENYGGVIKMLDQLLVKLRKNYIKATTILENEYQIQRKIIEKEALEMCNLASGIYDDGIEDGRKDGKTEGRLATLKDLVTDPDVYVRKLISYGISEEQYNVAIADNPDLKPDFDVTFPKDITESVT